MSIARKLMLLLAQLMSRLRDCALRHKRNLYMLGYATALPELDPMSVSARKIPVLPTRKSRLVTMCLLTEVQISEVWSPLETM